MTFGSLIGFALVYVTVSWAVSWVSGLAVWLVRSRLRRSGASTERLASASALLLPPLLSGALVLGLVWRSFAGEHHCLVHDHHPHLCLYHGQAWTEVRWAVLVVGAFVAVLGARLAERVRSGWNASAARRALARTSQATDHPDVLLAPARSIFCFVAGLARPRIFISNAAWQALDASQRDAVVAHERAHISHGDLWQRYLLSVLALLGMPVTTRWLLDVWREASERLCDWRAAEQVGAEAVATALLKLARADVSRTIPFASSFTSGASTIDRVEALLRGDPQRATPSRLFFVGILGVSTAAAVVGVVHADPLHHAFETFFGAL